MNTGGELHLAYGITEWPEEKRNKISSKRALFYKVPHVICIGHRSHDQERPAVWPLESDKFFKTGRAKLPDFQAASQMDPAALDDQPLRTAAEDDVQEFLPFVPILGKELCQQVIDGIYNADNARNWKLAELPIKLRGYVNSIQDETTRLNLERAIMSMVTS